jgi:hypothetical protein
VGNTYIPEAYPGTDPIWKMRGDRRTNKTPDLIAISDVCYIYIYTTYTHTHTIDRLALQLFGLEHNRLCDEFAAANSDWDQDRLFEEARKWYARNSERPLSVLTFPVPPN